MAPRVTAPCVTARLVPAVLMAVLCNAAPALAQDVPGSEAARYSFHKVQDTFIRLDSQTGQVATCGHGASGWSCKLAPDERAALESEINRVQSDNAALKKELLARGIALPGNMKADAAQGTVPGPMAKAPEPNAESRPVPPRDVPGEPSVKLPSDAELDRVMGFMEKVWGRLVEMMARLQRDVQRKTEKSDKS
jgi:hypothetical protein